jgi:hypothetical protein
MGGNGFRAYKVFTDLRATLAVLFLRDILLFGCDRFTPFHPTLIIPSRPTLDSGKRLDIFSRLAFVSFRFVPIRIHPPDKPTGPSSSICIKAVAGDVQSVHFLLVCLPETGTAVLLTSPMASSAKDKRGKRRTTVQRKRRCMSEIDNN